VSTALPISSPPGADGARRVLEFIRDAIVQEDASGRIIYANSRFLDWYGLDAATLGPASLEGIAADEWKPALRDQRERRLRGEAVPAHYEFESIRADGERIWLDVLSTPMMEGGRCVGSQSVLRDISNRRHTAHATEALLRYSTLAVGDAFFNLLVSEFGKRLRVSLICVAEVAPDGEGRRIRTLAHYSEGQLAENFTHELDASDPSAHVLRSGEPLLISQGLQERHPGGTCGRKGLVGYFGIPLRAANKSAFGVLIIADVRPLKFDPLLQSLLNVFALRAEAELARSQSQLEKERLQARLYQNQKFEALGTLAGGIAHDFNNILTGILNYALMAQEDCPPSHPHIAEYLKIVLQCGQRAKELVRQILLFSRAEQHTREPLLLHSVIHDSLGLLRSTLPAQITIVTDLDPAAPPVLAIPSQVHQVIMNLGINAAHAIGEKSGRITVRLHGCDLDQDFATANPGLVPGRFVRIDVADTGCGMDEALLARIFDPFFTTKPVGQGTGLGLAVVRGVVTNHGGAVVVHSQPGAGSTFTLYFPAYAEIPAGDIPDAPEVTRGRGEHVLLVDDEETVLESTRLTLEWLGYRVTAFSVPGDALARF
jgi:PAS domain S-box-containing protein